MKRWTVRRAIAFERQRYTMGTGTMDWLVFDPDGILRSRHDTQQRAILIAQRYAMASRGHAEADR